MCINICHYNDLIANVSIMQVFIVAISPMAKTKDIDVTDWYLMSITFEYRNPMLSSLKAKCEKDKHKINLVQQ